MSLQPQPPFSLWSLLDLSVYNTLLRVFKPLYQLRVWLRSRRETDYAFEAQSRFGDTVALLQPWLTHLQQHTMPAPVWLHAVSVGETNVAIPFIEALMARGIPLLITNTTRTGRARLLQYFKGQLPATVASVFMPVDQPKPIERLLRCAPFACVAMVETELWPNVLHIAEQHGIATALLNARLSEKSCKGYAKVKALTTPMVASLDLIAAQDEAAAQRFIKLGAFAHRTRVCGNSKFDFRPPTHLLQEAEMLQPTLHNRWVWVAASTHAGEEEACVTAFKQLQQTIPHALLILVPRHPERFKDAAQCIEAHALPFVSRSSKAAIEPHTAVVLGDTMGEMWLWFALAQVAFVGGSLVSVGGHNPLEPAYFGLPVLMGSHTHNFATICTAFVPQAGLFTVNNAEDMVQTLSCLYTDAALYAQTQRNNQQLMQRNQGAFNRQLEHLLALYSTVSQQCEGSMEIKKG